MRTITLTASARYGYGGKQYIARITGRDGKFTFAREFVGTKSGKRRESAEYQTDEPGLYVTCDLDSKGRKDETYVLVVALPNGELAKDSISREDAMLIARNLDAGASVMDHVVVGPDGKDWAYWTDPAAAAKDRAEAAAKAAAGPPSGVDADALGEAMLG